MISLYMYTVLVISAVINGVMALITGLSLASDGITELLSETTRPGLTVAFCLNFLAAYSSIVMICGCLSGYRQIY